MTKNDLKHLNNIFHLQKQIYKDALTIILQLQKIKGNPKNWNKSQRDYFPIRKMRINYFTATGLEFQIPNLEFWNSSRIVPGIWTIHERLQQRRVNTET